MGMEGAAADSTSPAPPGEALRALLLWLPGFLRRVFETQLSEEYFAASPPEGTHSSSPRIPASGADTGAPEPTAHPAGISKNWSMLYVWLQYAQWCGARPRTPLAARRESTCGDSAQVQSSLLASRPRARRLRRAVAPSGPRGVPCGGAAPRLRDARAGLHLRAVHPFHLDEGTPLPRDMGWLLALDPICFLLRIHVARRDCRDTLLRLHRCGAPRVRLDVERYE